MASSLHELGMILQKKGDLDEAESQYRASHCVDRRIHGEDAVHPDIATSMHQLGEFLLLKGDLDGAESQDRASLFMKLRRYNY